MSATEVIVVVGGLIVGYWVMAVFVPSLWDGELDDKPAADDHPDRSPEVPDAAPVDVVRWFEVLEIPASSSREEITLAYKQQIRQYHPDRVAQMGRELRELAEIKSKEINVAYDIGLKLRSGSWHA